MALQIWNSSFGPLSERIFKPSMDVIETKEGYKLTLNVPGFKKEDLKIEATRDFIEIKTEKATQSIDEEKWNALHLERGLRKYYRKIAFRYPIDVSATKILLNDGVLTIEVKKIPELQKVELNVN